MFKITAPGEATSNGELFQWSHIMIVILKLEKHLSMGLGTPTLEYQQLAMMLLAIDMVVVLVPNS